MENMFMSGATGAGRVKNRRISHSNIAFSEAERAMLANQGNREAQFQLGMHYLKLSNYFEAERWLRYAAAQGHYKAYRSLILGARLDYFLSTGSRINFIAIEILETFVSPNPTQLQIDELEAVITHHLNTEFNLMKQHREKE